MKIDCCDLACPQPVLKTKKAIEEIEDDSLNTGVRVKHRGQGLTF